MPIFHRLVGNTPIWVNASTILYAEPLVTGSRLTILFGQAQSPDVTIDVMEHVDCVMAALHAAECRT